MRVFFFQRWDVVADEESEPGDVAQLCGNIGQTGQVDLCQRVERFTVCVLRLNGFFGAADVHAANPAFAVAVGRTEAAAGENSAGASKFGANVRDFGGDSGGDSHAGFLLVGAGKAGAGLSRLAGVRCWR